MCKFTQNVEITQNCNFCVLCLNVETSQISTLRSLKNQSGFPQSDNPSTYISGIYIIENISNWSVLMKNRLNCFKTSVHILLDTLFTVQYLYVKITWLKRIININCVCSPKNI